MRRKAGVFQAWLGAAVLGGAALWAPLPALAVEVEELAALRAAALALVNETRRAHGLSMLRPADTLDGASQAHAEDMLQRGYYDHVSPEGVRSAGRYAVQGGGSWSAIAENLMRCEGCPDQPTAETILSFHRSWMNSSGHRDAILRDGVTDFGFGIASRDGVIYAVEMFVRRAPLLDRTAR